MCHLLVEEYETDLNFLHTTFVGHDAFYCNNGLNNWCLFMLRLYSVLFVITTVQLFLLSIEDLTVLYLLTDLLISLIYFGSGCRKKTCYCYTAI